MVNRYLDRIEVIDRLIRIKGTGTPDQLAKKLNISKRTLYELISIMRLRGAEIKYDRIRSSYYYHSNGRFCIGFLTD